MACSLTKDFAPRSNGQGTLARRCLLGLGVALLATLAGTNRADAAYTVWQCYGGYWNASYSNIQDYNRAVYFRDANIKAGFPSVITTGARPTAKCNAPAKKCLYYVRLKYNGRYYYIGGYQSSSAAYSAFQNINRAYGYKLSYVTTYKECS
ncbi:MAG: hypothetical protein AB7O62_17845 [Pirellulales bacterium]